MPYFLRARTYLQYSQLLLEDLLSGKKKLTFNHLREIFWQTLKALYAMTETKVPEKSPTPAEVINKILPTLNERERQKILSLNEIFFSDRTSDINSDINSKELRKLLEEIMEVMEWVKGSLKI
ncbi:MAG: hypothetical protein ACK4UR_02095 [Caldimicrobium sp.]